MTIQDRIRLLNRHGDFDPQLIAGVLDLDPVDVVGVLADPSHVPSSGGNVWEPVTVPTDQASWNVGNAASVTGDSAATVPLVVVGGSNDEFVYTPSSTSVPETFTVAPGTYSTLAALKAAVAAATGSGSSERFDSICSLSDDGSKLTFTEIVHRLDGSTITEGVNDVAAALGFTGNPDTFAGQTGSIGRWVFNEDGSISQTDATSTDGLLVSLGDEFGLAWAVQSDARGDALQDAQFNGLFGAGAVFPPNGSIAISTAVAGAGVEGSLPTAYSFGDAGQAPDATSVPIDEWHTYRVLSYGDLGFLWFDGTGVAYGIVPPQNSFAGAWRSAFVLTSYSAVTYRNLKAWRVPMPTLP